MSIVNHIWLTQPEFARQTMKDYGSVPTLPEDLSLGVAQVGPNPMDLSSNHLSSYWCIGMIGYDVNIYYYKSGWVLSDTILTLTTIPDSIKFDFDQLGRAIILIEDSGEVWVNFPNNQGDFELQKVADGTQASIVYDNPLQYNTDQSDLIVFYKNTGNQLSYLYQRDRFEVEYLVPDIVGDTLEVGDSSFSIDRRVQVHISGISESGKPDGECQLVTVVPSSTYLTTRVRAIQELPSGKILVGRSAINTQVTGYVGLSDSLRDIVNENITNEIQTKNYSEFAVISSDATRTIFFSANPLNDSLYGDPMEVVSYSVDNSSGLITELSRLTLLDGTGSLQGLAYGNNKLFCMIKVPSSTQLVIYEFEVIDPEQLTLGDGLLLVENLELLIGYYGAAPILSLAYRNNTLFMCNSVKGELYQIDLTILKNNCTTELTTSSPSQNIGINVSFNNAKTQIWSVQDISLSIPIEVYELGV